MYANVWATWGIASVLPPLLACSANGATRSESMSRNKKPAALTQIAIRNLSRSKLSEHTFKQLIGPL